MGHKVGSPERPLRVAIIGSGPSGFYVAEPLLSTLTAVEVDIYDRLPTPYGLIRYGVAPDHPRIKNVTKVYEKLFENPRLHFLGNVTVGRDIAVRELRKFYDAVIFACGAQTDKPLKIPNEHLKGSHAATEFVAWYNGHPDYQYRQFDLSHPVAVIVGLGNVAMDVARILCKTADELKSTDITQKALDALAESRVREVHVIGRRGPAQAAFTPAEIREFGELSGCDTVVNPADILINPESLLEIEDPAFPVRKKNLEILKEYSRKKRQGRPKTIILHFLKSPMALEGVNRIEGVVLEHNRLSGKAGNQNAIGTGRIEELPCGIIFRSVGYQGIPIPGAPFDSDLGIFPNIKGRLMDKGATVPGFYAAGWIKRGATGIIGTNKPDSLETAQSLIADVPNLAPCPYPEYSSVLAFLREKNIRVVSFEDWKKIEQLECERGAAKGKPREKITSVDEMLRVL